MVKSCGTPTQVPDVGVTVNTPLSAVIPTLVDVKEAIALPDPLAPIPIEVLLFTQLYVVPGTLLEKFIVDVFASLQTDCDAGDTLTSGKGLQLQLWL